MKIKQGVTEDILLSLGFKKVCNMYIKGGMSINLHKGYCWIASYKQDLTEDINSLSGLIEFMEKKGVK